MAVRKALEAEAKDESIKFTFRGVSLVVSTGENVDIDVMKAYEDGKMVTFVMATVGREQWSKLQKAGVKTVKDLNELADAMFAAMGSSSGE